MLIYMKNTIWDYVLCVVASTALAYTACSGFYSTQVFQDVAGTAVIAGICAFITLLLFLVSRTSKSALIGGPILAAALVAAIVASAVLSTTETALDDVVGNYLYFSLIVVLSAVLTYVLSRWKASTVVLIVVGVLLCAVIEYLYWYGHVIALVVFLVAAGALFAYRAYQKSLLESSSEHLAFGSVTASGAALALASALFGVGVFALLIAPLDPPGLVVKLFTEEVRAQEQEVRGIASTEDAPSETLYSDVLGSDFIYSSNVNDELYNELSDNQIGRGNAGVVQVRNSSMSLGSMDDEEGSDDALSLDWPSWLWLVILASILALIVIAILVKKLLRRRRYRRFLALGSNGAVESLYRFFLERFGRFGMPTLGAMTLAEYAANYESTLDQFGAHPTTPRFGALTEAYTAHVFGGTEVEDTQLGLFKSYYKVFYKNARRYVGRLKYLLLFFRV